jgi:hypothetical protein
MQGLRCKKGEDSGRDLKELDAKTNRQSWRSWLWLKMWMFVTSEKAKPKPESIKGLSLVAIRRTTVLVTIRQPL